LHLYIALDLVYIVSIVTFSHLGNYKAYITSSHIYVVKWLAFSKQNMLGVQMMLDVQENVIRVCSLSPLKRYSLQIPLILPCTFTRMYQRTLH